MPANHSLVCPESCRLLTGESSVAVRVRPPRSVRPSSRRGQATSAIGRPEVLKEHRCPTDPPTEARVHSGAGFVCQQNEDVLYLCLNKQNPPVSARGLPGQVGSGITLSSYHKAPPGQVRRRFLLGMVGISMECSRLICRPLCRAHRGKVPMNLDDALHILTQELIESHARSHYPYVLTCGPCSITESGRPQAGVYAQLNSEVFGRIAASSAFTMEEVLIQLAQELTRTREERWAKESA
jgi:hypothetical protein